MAVPKFEWIKMALWGKGDPRWIVEERPDSKNVNNWHWWVTLSFCLPYLWLYSISCSLDFFYKTLFRHNSLYITSSICAYPNEKFLPVLEEQAQELPEWEVKNRKAVFIHLQNDFAHLLPKDVIMLVWNFNLKSIIEQEI